MPKPKKQSEKLSTRNPTEEIPSMPGPKKTRKKRPSRAKPKPRKDVTSIYPGDLPPRRLKTRGASVLPYMDGPKFLPLAKADDPSTD